MDQFTIRTVEDFSHAVLPVDAKPLLLIEVDGHPAEVAEDAETVEAISEKYNLTIDTFGHAGDGNLHPTILTVRR